MPISPVTLQGLRRRGLRFASVSTDAALHGSLQCCRGKAVSGVPRGRVCDFNVQEERGDARAGPFFSLYSAQRGVAMARNRPTPQNTLVPDGAVTWGVYYTICGVTWPSSPWCHLWCMAEPTVPLPNRGPAAAPNPPVCAPRFVYLGWVGGLLGAYTSTVALWCPSRSRVVENRPQHRCTPPAAQHLPGHPNASFPCLSSTSVVISHNQSGGFRSAAVWRDLATNVGAYLTFYRREAVAAAALICRGFAGAVTHLVQTSPSRCVRGTLPLVSYVKYPGHDRLKIHIQDCSLSPVPRCSSSLHGFPARPRG